MRIRKPAITFILLFLALIVPAFARAQSACSSVSMEILQELTLERVAFDARMVITNNIPDKDLANVRVDVTIKDGNGNVKNDLFYIRTSSTGNIASVDGAGIVKAATRAEVHWLIIPSPGAGGSVPTGVAYWVGATLTYTVAGVQETVTVNPDKITVRPEAQLILDYFLPYDVLGDNPFTPEVEAPVPFPLAVRILNAGFGPASNLKIDSAQPKIVDNSQGLLVDFRLLGAAVNDGAVAPSLTVNIGTLGSKQIATAYWEMLSTLSGKFVDFHASFSHASDLGGELTSLLKVTNTYYFVHRVKVNLAGRDNRLDILADTDKDPDHLPDTIFESEIPGGTGRPEDSRTPVSVVAVTTPPTRPTSEQPNVELKLATGSAGWIYARTGDPAGGMQKLLDVIRADGVRLDANNFWISEGLGSSYQRTFTLHLLDYRSDPSVSGNYTLVYDKPTADLLPPSTTLVFSGPRTGVNPVYITPETTIIFKAVDNDGGSGVEAMYRKVVGIDADFVNALPLKIANPGAATLEYYSKDRAGNREATKTTELFVDTGAPNILSFSADPLVFIPVAPGGIAAPRTTTFVFKAADDTPVLKATIAIAQGAGFSETKIVRTFTASLASNTEMKLQWDGKDKNGGNPASGVYTARLSVSDGLDGATAAHTSTRDAQVTIAEWFKGEPLDPNLSGAQQFPKAAGTRVVWQDRRNGNWDIFTKDAAGGVSTALTKHAADQVRPAISGNIVVWQDNRNGNWDIYGFDLAANTEFPICTDPGNQERPAISGDWVVWQDDSAGNWDIYAYNLKTGGAKVRITSHERDQLHPAISGSLLTWEDYRHGLGEIYKYDLATGMEMRHTFDVNNQTLPSVSGSAIVWTDQRNGQRDIYYSTATSGETRVTYQPGDHSSAAVLNDLIVYTDYSAGLNDPNLAFYDIKAGRGGFLTTDPSRQEEPALGSGMVVWQDDRAGVYQIYWSSLNVEAMPIEVEIRKGFNLIAAGDLLARTHPKVSDMVSLNPGGVGIENVVTFDSSTAAVVDVSAAGDMPLLKGMGIGVYARQGGTIQVGDSGEATRLTLLPGVNYSGILTVPVGYTAYSMLESLGLGNAQSVRRYNSLTGAWETASVRETAGVREPVGVNFPLRQGDGLIITMKNRVDGWQP